MSKRIFVLVVTLFSFYSHADWFKLEKAHCNLSNGTLTYPVASNENSASIALGFYTKTFTTDPKVIDMDYKNADGLLWTISDFTTGRYDIVFDLKPTSIKKLTSLKNVGTQVKGNIPLPIPVWYQVDSQVDVGSGYCDITISPWN